MPAATLWAALAADDAVVSWGVGATGMRWTTPKPYGVGTVREVTVAGIATVREQFYRWDEGQRMSFFVAESTRPGIRRMVEDYVVEETATGSRLTRTVALEVSHLAGPTAIVLKPVLGPAIGSMVNGLKKKLTTR
ncbi:SRPBCC family protein [Nocardioides sp. B-3]|uniref:SRPBCC family protein n=1 Tax=Nocardioides sp. B-3 TaxID=2895565 RepID=UPI002152D470|nr:SRPBCC family protein [Nocardioides sp. B-3]UUZ61362.1 SRPBCC family protein [Nocardioides sp. B-3]